MLWEPLHYGGVSSTSSQILYPLTGHLIGWRRKDQWTMLLDFSETEFWYWAPAANYLSSSDFSFTWRLIRNALSLNDETFREGLGRFVLLSSAWPWSRKKKRLRTPSTIALCNYIGKLTARIDREFFVSIVLACAYDNVSPSLSRGEINVASHDASCGKNGNADVADGGNLTI